MCAVVIITRRDYLPSFDKHGSQSEAHGTLRGSVLTLHQESAMVGVQ